MSVVMSIPELETSQSGATSTRPIPGDDSEIPSKSDTAGADELEMPPFQAVHSLFQIPDSPYAQFLEDSAIDIDRDTVNQLLSAAETTRLHLEREIDRSIAYLTTLQARREEFMRFSINHRQLLSPSRKLPGDILRLIFLECFDAEKEWEDGEYSPSIKSESSSGDDCSLHTESDLESDIEEYKHIFVPLRGSAYSLPQSSEGGISEVDSDSDYEYGTYYQEPLATLRPPWIFAHVCSRWREVALSSPELWSRISVNLDVEIIRCHSTSPHLLEQQLIYAQKYPLSIEIFGRNDNTQLAETLLSILARYSDQWATIHIVGPLPILQSLSSVRGKLNSLTKLELSVSLNQPRPYTYMALEIAPKLVEFVSVLSMSAIEKRPSSFPFRSVRVPWSQLTRLTIHLKEGDDRALLRETPNLEECALSTVTLDSLRTRSYEDPQYIQLKYLRSLFLTPNSTKTGLISILNYLIAPSLQTLSLEYRTPVLLAGTGDPDPESNHLLVLQEFLQRIRRPLTTLRLPSRVSLFQRGVSPSQLLTLTPNLQELSIPVNSEVASFNFLQCVPDHTPVLVPCLRTLRLHSAGRVNLAPILDIVESRWNHEYTPVTATVGGGRLQVCTIEAYEFTDDGEITDYRVDKLKAEGMDINVTVSFWNHW